MANSTQVGVCVCVITVIVFISCLLFGLSWSVLEPLQAGLDQNTFSKTIDKTRVYDGGRYMLGLGHSFIKYPTTFLIIDFSQDTDQGGPALSAGTKDGQPITIEVTLYYTLKTEELADLYGEFAENYQEKFERVAQSTIKNTATKFPTIEYFSKRDTISGTMLTEVAAAFEPLHAKVELLQLRGISLANSFEQRLTDNVIATQEQIKAEFEKSVALVEAGTDVLLAVAQGNITQTLGQAKATSSLISEEARAEGTKLVVEVEREQYAELRNALGFTNSQLYQFLWATRKIRLANAKDTLVVGFGDGARINLPGTASAAQQ